ncbi:MAG TPA: hypothetical protein VGO31_01220 [Microbacteriaceae bacterium]|nr:hypothetical protein [Microbacteriaceae bacterium]
MRRTLSVARATKALATWPNDDQMNDTGTTTMKLTTIASVLSGDFPAAVRDLKAEPAGTPLELVDSQVTPQGVTIQAYRPTGRPQQTTATAA